MAAFKDEGVLEMSKMSKIGLTEKAKLVKWIALHDYIVELCIEIMYQLVVAIDSIS